MKCRVLTSYIGWQFLVNYTRTRFDWVDLLGWRWINMQNAKDRYWFCVLLDKIVPYCIWHEQFVLSFEILNQRKPNFKTDFCFKQKRGIMCKIIFRLWAPVAFLWDSRLSFTAAWIKLTFYFLWRSVLRETTKRRQTEVIQTPFDF